MLSLQELYDRVVGDAAAGLQGKLYLHPVLPVLKETRFLTHAFNSALFSRPARGASLRLPLPPVYESGAGISDIEASHVPQSILPSLVLDGTHISPSYVASHLAPAFSMVGWPPGGCQMRCRVARGDVGPVQDK